MITVVNDQGQNEKISVYDALIKRFPPGEYALMQEVSDKAGFGRSRSADFILMNLWPSRGLHLTGIEVKSHRGDWLNEMRNPKKAENIYQYCDYFVLLTTSEHVAKSDEIPATWGWWTIKGKKVVTMKEPPKLQPCAIDRSFLAALLKRASNKDNFVHVDTIEDRIEESVGIRTKSIKSSYEYSQKDLEYLKEKIRNFEQASGININDGWNDEKKIGNAVRIILNHEHTTLKNRLIELQKTADKISNEIKMSIQGLS